MIETQTLQDPLEMASGSPYAKTMSDLFSKSTRVKIFTGNLTDPETVAFVEKLKTKSLHCQGYLKNAGDLVLIDYKGTFDKEGNYCVYVEYYENAPEGENA